MPYADAIAVVRELPVPLTDAELSGLGQHLAAKKAEKDGVEARKRKHVADCNAELKEIGKAIDKVAAAINQKCEMREIPCEERRDLETGEIVVFRLDRDPPEEVTRRPYGEDESEDQPSLFAGKRKRNAPPEAPALRCTAIDADGCAFPISAEQADAADREIAANGTARLEISNPEAGTGVVFAVKVVRGRACEFCGSADGNHRPECDGLRAQDDAGDEGEGEADVEPYPTAEHFEPMSGDDDEHDTGELALQLANSPLPSDDPLVPKEGSKPPKKSAKKSARKVRA